MKANGPKRKIFDAVDMMTEDMGKAENGNGLQSLPVDKIKTFHDHPFRLYEGERLDDMVESIREHGVLNPVIVRNKGIGTCGHDVHKSRSRDGIGEEYGMTGRNIARYMRVDKLIPEFKDKLDDREMTLTTAVELSYLSEEEQGIVAAEGTQINESTAKAIRAAAGELTAEKLEEIMHPAKKTLPVRSLNIKIPSEAGEKYFSGMKAKERTDLVMKALDAWFAKKETAHV